MNKLLPKTRGNNIIEQDFEGELLIYDLASNKAYVLNETSKAVYRACDGLTSFDEFKARHRFTDELIHLALDELQKNGLLESDYASPLAGLNRREVVKRIGLACAVALPVISTLVAPTAAQAGSNGCPPGSTYTPGQFFNVCFNNGNASERDASCNAFAPGRCCSGRASASPQLGSCPYSSVSYACLCSA